MKMNVKPRFAVTITTKDQDIVGKVKSILQRGKCWHDERYGRRGCNIEAHVTPAILKKLEALADANKPTR